MIKIKNENGEWAAIIEYDIPKSEYDKVELKAVLAQTEGLCELIQLELVGIEINPEENNQVILTVTGGGNAKQLASKIHELTQLWDEILEGYKKEDQERKKIEKRKLMQERMVNQKNKLNDKNKMINNVEDHINKQREKRNTLKYPQNISKGYL